jgi:hypothetical protein
MASFDAFAIDHPATPNDANSLRHALQGLEA